MPEEVLVRPISVTGSPPSAASRTLAAAVGTAETPKPVAENEDDDEFGAPETRPEMFPDDFNPAQDFPGPAPLLQKLAEESRFGSGVLAEETGSSSNWSLPTIKTTLVGPISAPSNNSNTPSIVNPPKPNFSAGKIVVNKTVHSLTTSIVGELNIVESSTTTNSVLTKQHDDAKYPRRTSMNNSYFSKVVASPLVEGSGSGGSGSKEASSNSRSGRRKRKVMPRKIDERRLMMFENVIHRMRDPETGIELKDRTRLFTLYPNTFLGSEIVDWIGVNCNFFGREEATKFATNLFDAGYFVSVDLLEKFEPDNSPYIFQTSYFWTSINFEASDRDYLIYLIRRSGKTTAKYQLLEEEEWRLKEMKRTFKIDRANIEAQVKLQDERFEQLSKNDKRVYALQEFCFWRIQRPITDNHSLAAPADDPLEKKSHGNVSTEAYEASLTEEDLLAFTEKKVEILQGLVALNRSKVSTVSKNIVHKCDVLKPFDPFLDPGLAAANPYITDDPKWWDTVRKTPTKQDLYLWCNSFHDLLRDPMGVHYFSNFLKTEFSSENLDFHLAILRLDTIATYAEFLEASIRIFEEFIKVGSPRELNITSGTRQVLIAQFDAVRGGNSNGGVNSGTGAATDSSASQSSGSPVAAVPTSSPSSDNNNSIDVNSNNMSVGTPVTPQTAGTFTSSMIPNLENSLNAAAPIHAAFNQSDAASIRSHVSTTSKANAAATAVFSMGALKRLPYNVFGDAHHHIVKLMSEDSYTRFLASEIIQDLLKKTGLDADSARGKGFSRRNINSLSTYSLS